MRQVSIVMVLCAGCGPGGRESAVGASFLELARHQHSPAESRTEGVVHFRGQTAAWAEVTVIDSALKRHDLLADELGRFGIELPTRQVEMVVARSGDLMGMTNEPAIDVVDVELIVPWKVHGTVTDETGAPVPGAAVSATWAGSSCVGNYHGLAADQVNADELGRYELRFVTPFSFISATAHDGRSVESELSLFGGPERVPRPLVIPSKPAERWNDLTLRGPVDWSSHRSEEVPLELAVKVHDEFGSPLDGIRTDWRNRASRTDRVVATQWWSTSSYELLGSLEISPSLSLARRGYVDSTVPFSALERSFVDLGSVSLQPARGLTVTVVDYAGVPISGCSLNGYSVSTDATGTAWMQVANESVQVAPFRCCRGPAVTVEHRIDEAVLVFERDPETCRRPPNG